MIYRALIGIVCGTVAAYLGVSLQDRDPPTEFHKIEAIPFDVKDGEVRIHFEIIRHRQCEFRSERVLFDSTRTRWLLDEVHFSRSPGPIGPDQYITVVQLPKMATGPARYVMVSRYYCNPLHYIWPIVVGPVYVGFNVVGD
jgi:hypothetical protein